MVLQGQAGIPDAAAEQGRVLHQGLGKAVVAAPEDLAVAGLLHAPARKLLRVDHGAAVKALQQKDGLAQKRAGEDVVQVVLAVHLAEGDAAVNKLLHVLRALAQLGPPAQQKGGDALDHPVVAIAVDDVQPPPPLADIQVPADDVVVAAHAQKGVQGLLVLLQPGG